MPSTATQSFSLVVNVAPLAINSPAPTSAIVGVAWGHTFTATGGVPPYKWSIATPIPGLSLDPNNGTLSGTPTTAGTFSDTVTVTDSAP